MFVAVTAIFETRQMDSKLRIEVRLLASSYGPVPGNWQTGGCHACGTKEESTATQNSLLVQVQSGPFCDTVTANTKNILVS